MGPFLINGRWEAKYDYGDIDQVRGILTYIQNVGINVVYIDMTNPSQWTRLWDEFKPMIDNIRAVCAEKKMEYFIMIQKMLPTLHESMRMTILMYIIML